MGYVEGRNIAIEYRYAEGRLDRLPNLAAELVALQPNVILAVGGDVAPIAEKVDQKIPLVFVSSADPEQLGLVASLRRPGGNATGVTLLQDALASKRLELLKEALPNISRVGFVWYPDHPDNEYREAERAAQTLGLRLHSAEVRSSDDFEAALSRANDEGIDAIYVVSSRLTVLNLTGWFSLRHNIVFLWWAVGELGLKKAACFRMDLTALPWLAAPPTTSTRYLKVQFRVTFPSSSRQNLN
jgi:putative ABC transport system substrate-binding protein